MSIIQSVAGWLLKKRLNQIQFATDNPIETQLGVFQSLVNTAIHTEWGEKHTLSKIDSIESFAESVPVNTYEELFPFIDKTMKGGKDILWPGKIKWFSKSSGTTNDKSKFIPVSDESLYSCHFKGGKDMLALYLQNKEDSGLFRGKSIALSGTLEKNPWDDDSYYGDLSGVLRENLPTFIGLFQSAGKKLSLHPNWEEKLELIARDSSEQDVRCVSGVPSWAIILFKKIMELKGASNMLEVWPEFEVFFHGGVSIAPYRKQLKELFPSSQVSLFEVYNASEGFFAVRDNIGRDDMLLMLDNGIYYEFIPLDELGNKHPRFIPLEDVEPGVTYALVISTNGGLWRYLIGDTIKFTTKFPFRIVVAGRTKHFINLTGEELMVGNAEVAIAHASTVTGVKVNDFTAGPILSGTDPRPPGHEWIIEFQDLPENLDFFIETLDNKLKALNTDYESKRYRDIALARPIVHPVKGGTFYHWLKHRGRIGAQVKVPRLSNDRKYLDELLKMIAEVT